MRVNTDLRGRRSIRLKGWDYASPGWYFVTICVQNRECMFGHIANNKIFLTDAGRMIEKIWLNIHEKYLGIALDEFVIMPNHIHGIVGLYVGAGPCACPSASMDAINHQGRGRASARRTAYGSPRTENRLSLPDLIRQFKTMTAKRYSEGVIQCNWPEFHKRLWQRNYYEHIIRSDKELDQTRQYVRDNPAAWPLDDENPERRQYP